MAHKKNNKNLIMPTWYLLNKYEVLDYDLEKGAYNDTFFDKSQKFILYRKEVVRRLDDKILQINENILKGKDSTKLYESALRLLSVLHGVDVPERISKMFELSKNDFKYNLNQKITTTLDLIDYSVKNMCKANEIKDDVITQCIKMIDYSLDYNDKFHTLFNPNGIDFDRIYKNVAFANNIVSARARENVINDEQGVVNKHLQYLKWEYYHSPDDNSLQNYPQKTLSSSSINFLAKYKGKEGM